MSNQTSGLTYEPFDIFYENFTVFGGLLAKFHEDRLKIDREISEKDALQVNVTLPVRI